MDLKQYIVDVPDFPKQGVVFKDITPLLNNGKVYKYVIDQMIAFAKKRGANVIVAPEARGFLFGTAVSYGMGLRFVPIRKPNKLPRKTISRSFHLEYGSETLEMHQDALNANDRVMIIDDVMATGNTAKAMAEMISDVGATVVGFSFLIDLTFLNGRKEIESYPMQALIEY